MRFGWFGTVPVVLGTVFLSACGLVEGEHTSSGAPDPGRVVLRTTSTTAAPESPSLTTSLYNPIPPTGSGTTATPGTGTLLPELQAPTIPNVTAGQTRPTTASSTSTTTTTPTPTTVPPVPTTQPAARLPDTPLCNSAYLVFAAIRSLQDLDQGAPVQQFRSAATTLSSRFADFTRELGPDLAGAAAPLVAASDDFSARVSQFPSSRQVLAALFDLLVVSQGPFDASIKPYLNSACFS